MPGSAATRSAGRLHPRNRAPSLRRVFYVLLFVVALLGASAVIYGTPWAASASKPQCNNRIDDDGDGKIDYPTDPGCTGRGDKREVDPPPPPPGGSVQELVNATPDGGTVSLEPRVYTEGTVTIAGRNNLTVDGNGAFIQGAVGDGHQPVFRLQGGTNISFLELTLDGAYTNPGVHDTAVQWSHGIESLGTAGVSVDGLTIRNVAGDCVYAGLGAQRSSAVRVNGVLCDGTGRNGVSAVAVNDLLVTGGTYDRIGFIAFDVEPNPVTGSGVDGAVFDGSQVGSFRLDTGGIYGCNTVSNVTFRNLHTFGFAGARFTARADCGQRRTNVILDGNTSAFTRAGDAARMGSVDGLSVTNNALPNTGVLLRCVDVSALTYFGNTPNTFTGC
jgi:hypothetical protein